MGFKSPGRASVSWIIISTLRTVEFAAGPPSQWLVTLRSGATMELAADGYAEHDGQAIFSVIATATPDEREQVHILDWPVGAHRIVMLVAKIPVTEIAEISGGWPWPATPRD